MASTVGMANTAQSPANGRTPAVVEPPASLSAPMLLLVDAGSAAEKVRTALAASPEGFRVMQVEAVGDANFAGELPMCAMLVLKPGDHAVLDQVRALRASSPLVPIIVLIDSESDESIGVLAMHEGAQDYLLLSELNAKALRRSIRYAVERKRAIDALVIRDATHRGVLDALRESVAVLNRAGSVVSANRRWTDSVAGYLARTATGSAGAGIGSSYASILTAWGDEGWTREALAGLRRILDGEITSYDVPRTIEREGATYAVRLRGLPTGGAFVIHDDVTALVRADQALNHAAMHDALTGLPNRPLFHDRVERALARVAAGKAEGFAILVVDIDRFTVVNDTHGHAAGDVVLAALASRIREAAGVTDTVARFGGDQFVVVSEEAATESAAQLLALKIREAVAAPVGYAELEIRVVASIGIAICSDATSTVPELVRDASAALGEARHAGPSRSRVLSATGREAAASRLDIESGLRRAIARDELVLHYLPEVTSKGRRLNSVEALVRWEHPSRGLLAPREFLPVAEQAGLIVEIGNWVIERACADSAIWRREVSGADNIGVSVNLSSQHVGDLRLLDTVSEALRRNGLPARLLTLEITEDVMLNDAEEILEALQALRSYGVRLAVDDFGTGFSSLAYLCALPVQALKMDQDFAAQVVENERNRTVVGNIVTMAHELDLVVTAEGVENERQAAMLDGIGVDLLQGFHFGLPVDLHGLMGNLPTLLG
jgi:diguanylate cyclase (GGDEF)-like protein